MNSDGAFLNDEIDVKRVWRKNFINLRNIGSNEEVIVNECRFDGIRRNRCF